MGSKDTRRAVGKWANKVRLVDQKSHWAWRMLGLIKTEHAGAFHADFLHTVAYSFPLLLKFPNIAPLPTFLLGQFKAKLVVSATSEVCLPPFLWKVRFTGPKTYLTCTRDRETYFLLLMIVFLQPLFVTFFFTPSSISMGHLRPNKNFFSPTNPLTPFPMVPPAPQLCPSFSVDYFSVRRIRIMSRYRRSLQGKDVTVTLFTGNNWQ